MSKAILLLFGCLIFCFSCETEPTTLSQNEKLKINKMYNEDIKLLRMEADSLCTIYYDEWFKRAVDSIRNERMEEIELLMKDK